MFGDYEDELLEKVQLLMDTLGIETVLDTLDMSPAEAIVKLIMEGHIDEENLPRVAT